MDVYRFKVQQRLSSAASLWRIVDYLFAINVSSDTLLGVEDFYKYDNIVTLVYFLISKE